MILNSNDIRDLGLISNGFEEEKLGEGSYELRVKDIIIRNTWIKSIFKKRTITNEEIRIPPNGLVIAISKEEITLPKNIIGFAHIKTSLSQKGILAINTGIIDPEYKGHISTVLINYSSEERPLKEDDSILRLTFHYINPNSKTKSKPQTSNYKGYRDDVYEKSEVLDETFINQQKIIDSAKRSILKTLWFQVLAFGTLIGIITAIWNYAYNTKFNKTEIEMLESKIDKQNEIISAQNKKIDLILNPKKESSNASHKGK